MKVVSDYRPRIAGAVANERVLSVADPLSGTAVPLSQLSEHMRVQLLDPRYFFYLTNSITFPRIAYRGLPYVVWIVISNVDLYPKATDAIQSHISPLMFIYSVGNKSSSDFWKSKGKHRMPRLVIVVCQYAITIWLVNHGQLGK
jgi:hypothetical protein